jgi:hypothetical protein
LVQTIDLAPTLLGWFGVAPPPSVQGADLSLVLASPTAVVHPDGGLFGIFGGQVNIVDCDARYVYMRGCTEGTHNEPLLQYTLFPTEMRGFMNREQLSRWHQHHGFEFTKGMRVMEIAGHNPRRSLQPTLLYDVVDDPGQLCPLGVEFVTRERELMAAMVRLMAANEAPPSQYTRLGLPTPDALTSEALTAAAVLGTARGERDRARNGSGAADRSRNLLAVWAGNLAKFGPEVIKSSL